MWIVSILSVSFTSSVAYMSESVSSLLRLIIQGMLGCWLSDKQPHSDENG